MSAEVRKTRSSGDLLSKVASNHKLNYKLNYIQNSIFYKEILSELISIKPAYY